VAIIAVYTGLGAATGLGIDALVIRRQTIYRPATPTASLRLRVLPLLAANRKGVTVRLDF
jgi:hypothetical protein